MSSRRLGLGATLLATVALGAGGVAWAQEDGEGGGDGEPPEVSEEEREARRAAFEEFRSCMAEHGVELPEPPAPGEGEEGRPPEGERPEIDPEVLEAAREACADLIPPPPGVSQEDWDAHRAALEEYRACLEEHGVDVGPAPVPGGPRGPHGPAPGDGESPDVSEEARATFEAAQEACADLRPEPLPGVPGPGGCRGDGPGRPPEDEAPPEDDAPPEEETAL